jgi:hypothetical protein
MCTSGEAGGQAALVRLTTKRRKSECYTSSSQLVHSGKWEDFRRTAFQAIMPPRSHNSFVSIMRHLEAVQVRGAANTLHRRFGGTQNAAGPRLGGLVMNSLTRLTVLGSGLLLVAVGCARHTTPGTTTATLPSSTGTPVIVTSPRAPANPSVAGGVVHHVVTGEITDVDRNSGKVDIRASDGSKVQLVLPPLAVATTKKGDRASIDVTIGPVR